MSAFGSILPERDSISKICPIDVKLYFLLIVVASSTVFGAILRVNCGKESARSVTQSFCEAHGIDAEGCGSLVDTVNGRCLSWSGTEGDNILEVPVNIVDTPSCAFSIVVDGAPQCAFSSNEAASVLPEHVAPMAQKICDRFHFKAGDCDVLEKNLRPHVERAIEHRVLEARGKSGVTNHDASAPLAQSAMLVEMDLWRKRTGFGSTYRFAEDVGAPSCDGLIHAYSRPRDSESYGNREYVTKNLTITIDRRGLPMLQASSSAHVCLAVRPPAASSLYPEANGLDVGCFLFHQAVATVAVNLTNMPYGAFDIFGYFVDDDASFSTMHRCAAKLRVHVIPFLPFEPLEGMLKVVEPPERCPLHPLVKRPRPMAGPFRSIPQFSIVILVHRGRQALRKALESWQRSGLLSMAKERIVLVQELREPHDPRLDDNILKYYSLRLLKEKSQLGISLGLTRLVESTTSPFVLFLEEDFRVADAVSGLNEVQMEIHDAADLLLSARAHVVRMRHTQFPGVPNCANAWKGHEARLGNRETPARNNQSVLDVRSWIEDPSELYPDDVWSCGRFREHFCAYSTHASWTNNPIFFSRPWFLENIAPIARADTGTRLEAAVSFSNIFWSDQCYIFAHG